jgi:hypothetical protein
MGVMMSDYEDDGKYDSHAVGVLMLLGVLLLIMITATILYQRYTTGVEARERCENNPRLLYAQTCTDRESCLDACIRAQREEST